MLAIRKVLSPPVFSKFASKKIVISALLLTFLFAACSTTDEQAKVPALEIYQKAIASLESQSYNDAEEKFKKVIEQNVGTKLATFAYLKLGDLHFEKASWVNAETNYRLFLTLNPDSHLTPYVLHQLIALNYQKNVKGVWIFEKRSYDRDMEPNRKVVQEYKRFYFLYPNNAYLDGIRDYSLKARADLAEHEFMVGNFYYDQSAYDSAILRYLHLLKYYPEYPKMVEVGKKLILAYKKNQQPELANEMKEALKTLLEPKLQEPRG